ncbi:MAG: Cys-tRNA(Pro) deacylase [Sulfurospirillaceae bacterium]|jgi:Cys-tRNA(Pro)/Cys-tRNA(Cys) deacylase|nr:Cys-tRNA(Pro) deacylase [Sulfurospirillaceae bacterium]MDD2826084.1 Cys-tRNA(Pro) deacylase [Sulfurospirillaceae bacterium]
MSLKKTNAARFLDTLKVTYELTAYDVDEEDLSATHAAAMLGVTPNIVFKTLVARDEKNLPLVACIPADKEIDLKALARLANVKRCELVAVKELLAITGYIRGGCSPLGMKKKYPTFIDISAQNYPLIYVSAGLRGMQLHLNPQDLLSASKGVLGVIIKE